ncbi:MAG: murein biosynthesis integral membrane protein MurJ [Anaerolineae bacterium]|nr:murein biosynthesis integral membrane protein MurJ [Anaerolineae bacterium]
MSAKPDAPVTDAAHTTLGHLARSTVLLMIAFGAAKAISLLQTFIIARKIGLDTRWDSYITANRIPELLVLMIGGGALGYAFIPVFSGLLARRARIDAWKLASHVINTIFVVTATLSLFAFILAPWLVHTFLAPGFPPEQVGQAAALMRILLLSTLIFSVSGIFQGILHSHSHFLLPALAPILQDLGLLFGIVFLLDRFDIYGVAWGAVLGAALHFSIQLPGLIHYRARWWPELGWRDPNLRRVIVLMIPRLLGLGVVSFNFLVANNIASRLGEGAVSAFDWGWKLMQIPQTLIGTAMGFVIFPTLAALSELGDETGKRRAFAGALRFILVATIPSAVGLLLVGRPGIALLEGGAFDASATDMVYSALQFFAIGIILHSVLEITARGFYADKDTLTPLLAAVTGAVFGVLVALLLAPVLGVGALALANSAAIGVEVTMLMIILRRRWHGLNGPVVLGTLTRSALASVAMAVVILALDAALAAAGFGQDTGEKLELVVRVVAVVVVGGAVYVGAALLLGMGEIRQAMVMLLRRGARDEQAAPVLLDSEEAQVDGY